MARRTGRATIKQVAMGAGVSTQTVSRVINERPDVSSETRQKVQEVIEKLSFQPNALARSLIHQRSYTLGVVTAGLKYIGPSRTLNGITNAAEAAGYALILKELPHFETNNIAPIFNALISHQVDGIIWAVPDVGENRNWINKLPIDLKIPVVYLAMKPEENISVVSIDNYMGGRLAMSHLYEQGYRNIGHISGPLDWFEARQRLTAWQDSVSEAGIQPVNEHWAEGNWSSSSAAQAVEKLFESYPEMDAIFVANDQMALSVLQKACHRGIRVPDDLGIVGFDNIAESAYFCPPLTTIQQDQDLIAKVAVEEVVKIIETGWNGGEFNGPRSITLTPSLVVRQSSLRSKA